MAGDTNPLNFVLVTSCSYLGFNATQLVTTQQPNIYTARTKSKKRPYEEQAPEHKEQKPYMTQRYIQAQVQQGRCKYNKVTHNIAHTNRHFNLN